MATAKCLVAADVFSQKYGDDAAGGTRALFILGSLAILPSEDVVSREPVTLSDEEKDVLSKSLALPPDRWTDLDVILAKYGQDGRISIGPQMIFTEDNEVTCESVLIRLREFFSTASDKDGGKNRTRIAISLLKFSIAVIIYYFGNGRKIRGDWCFSDGFITFQDLMDVYMETYRGHVLTIVSDCSYSGNWVKRAYEFMDGQGIPPCGHHAIEKGILLKVVASCRPTQTARVLGYSLYCLQFDKNDETIKHHIAQQIQKGQKSFGRDFTAMLCGKKVDEDCKQDVVLTWELKLESQRVFLVRGKDRGRPAWHYVLVVDDYDTIDNFLEAVDSGHVDVNDYGESLFCGFGKDPPNETTDKLHKKYKVQQ